MKCILIGTALLLGLTGCVTRIIEDPFLVNRPSIVGIRSDLDLLIVTVVQPDRLIYYSGFEAKVIKGDVYLIARFGRELRGAEFHVDMSDPKIPRDWKNRLYWLEDDISFPGFGREIRRSKVSFQQQKPNPSSEPTPTSATTSAVQEIAPATVAARL